MGSKRLTPTRVGKMASKCLLLLLLLVKERNPTIITTHCFIHCQALVAKTEPLSLLNVLNVVTQTVNYVKNSSLNSQLFKDLCSDIGSDYTTLLYYSSVQWLSRGNMLLYVLQLYDEIMSFLNIQD